eukprot:3366945-Pyramimonas_sp.AAC.1
MEQVSSRKHASDSEDRIENAREDGDGEIEFRGAGVRATPRLRPEKHMREWRGVVDAKLGHPIWGCKITAPQ